MTIDSHWPKIKMDVSQVNPAPTQTEIIEYLQAKVAELEAERYALDAEKDAWQGRYYAAALERDALKADAERYRWLVENGLIECPNCVTPWKCNGPHWHGQGKDFIDKELDAAMKEAK